MGFVLFSGFCNKELLVLLYKDVSCNQHFPGAFTPCYLTGYCSATRASHGSGSHIEQVNCHLGS